MKVLLIDMGAEVCFIRNTNLVVGVGDINLALGKPATESSTYTYSIPVAASYAVDGNTDGKFLDGSTTHTNDEQGAWWQVDLGSVFFI
jgi:hypothetical protein